MNPLSLPLAVDTPLERRHLTVSTKLYASDHVCHVYLYPQEYRPDRVSPAPVKVCTDCGQHHSTPESNGMDRVGLAWELARRNGSDHSRLNISCPATPSVEGASLLLNRLYTHSLSRFGGIFGLLLADSSFFISSSLASFACCRSLPQPRYTHSFIQPWLHSSKALSFTILTR